VAENTKISWATHTFNPWIGCTKVGPPCANCYAEDLDKRYWGGVHWGAGAPRKRTAPGNWRQPLKWERQAVAAGTRPRVFCASLADWADNEVPDEWRADLATLILATPHLDWLLLTKRVGNAAKMLPAMFPQGVPANVWAGITVADQPEADRDVWRLLHLKQQLGITIAFLSIEPMLGPIDLTRLRAPGCTWLNAITGEVHAGPAVFYEYERPLDLIFVGGESGRNPRHMPLSWPRALLEQTRGTGCAFHMKQLSQGDYPKNYRSFHLFPAELRVRELPAGVAA
jgi:protein gp37